LSCLNADYVMARTPAQPLLDRILDAARIGENDDWEFKSAKGGFPASLWETYCAMANSAGGTIVLGATERGATATLDGVTREQLEKLKKTFWDQHNNRQTINRALVASGDDQDIEVDTGWLLAIRIPPAARKDRPIYKGQNPLDGTCGALPRASTDSRPRVVACMCRRAARSGN